MRKGIGGHQSANSTTDEWITPKELLTNLGEFDLDPCSPIIRPWDTAKQHYTIQDNGLILPWEGRVWLNPPYGAALKIWMHIMAIHMNGISLIFARTETEAFQKYVFPVADSILFIENRLTFYRTDGTKAPYNSGAPSVLIAYGEQNVDALEESGIKGKHVFINSVPMIVVAMHKSWTAIITVALTRLDGEAPLNKIYEMVAQIAPDRVTKNKHFKEKIRQKLQSRFLRVRKGTYTVNTTN